MADEVARAENPVRAQAVWTRALQVRLALLERYRDDPQSIAAWSGPEWRPATARQVIRVRAGVAFDAGEVTVVRPASGRSTERRLLMAYSVRLGRELLVDPERFRVGIRRGR